MAGGSRPACVEATIFLPVGANSFARDVYQMAD